jgi:Helix-turn-helix
MHFHNICFLNPLILLDYGRLPLKSCEAGVAGVKTRSLKAEAAVYCTNKIERIPAILITWLMEPNEEQLAALGNYRDIIIQQSPKVAEALGVSQQTLAGWMEGKGEPTSEQAQQILDFLSQSNKRQ